MTPKEKAKDLIETFAEELPKIEYGVLIESDWNASKQCALIAVEEIIKELHFSDTNYNLIEKIHYYGEVKKEIRKLKNK